MPWRCVLARVVERPRRRTATFARYSFGGSLLAAAGSLAAALPANDRQPERDVFNQCDPGDVPAVCADRLRLRPGLSRLAQGAGDGSAPTDGAAAAIEKKVYTLPRCSASMPSPAVSWCSPWWRCGCISASTCRWRRRGCVLLDWRAQPGSYLVAVRIAGRSAGEYHGVHAHPFERVPDPAALRARRATRSALLFLRSALSQMDVHAQFLRDGDRDAAERPAAATSPRCRAASPPH